MKKSDILISPRVFGHDTPLKIFDYLSQGKCILATDRPNHNTVLNKDIAVLIEPTPESFIAAIRELQANKERIKEFEQKSLKFFNQNYSFEKMKENYSNLILKLNAK